MVVHLQGSLFTREIKGPLLLTNVSTINITCLESGFVLKVGKIDEMLLDLEMTTNPRGGG